MAFNFYRTNSTKPLPIPRLSYLHKPADEKMIPSNSATATTAITVTTTTTIATTTATTPVPAVLTTPTKPSVPLLKLQVVQALTSPTKSPRMLSPQKNNAQKIAISPRPIPNSLTPRKEKPSPTSLLPSSPKSEPRNYTNSSSSQALPDVTRSTTYPVLQVRRFNVVLCNISHDDKASQVKSVRQLSLSNISESEQVSVLVKLMVTKATTPLLQESHLGAIGKSDIYIDKDTLPSTLLPLCPRQASGNKASSKLMLHQLFQQLFFPAIKKYKAWNKAIDCQKTALQSVPSNFSFGTIEDEKKITIKSVMQPFATDIAKNIFGSSGKVKDIQLPASLIEFLIKADHQFFACYLDGSSMRIEKINEARLTFLKNMLITQLLAPLLNSFDSPTPVLTEAWFQGQKLSALIDSFKNVSKDFFEKSYAAMSASIKEKVAKKVKQEIAHEEFEEKNKKNKIVNVRIADFKSRSSNRSLRVEDASKNQVKIDISGTDKPHSFEEKIRKKIIQKKNAVLIESVLNELHFFSLNEGFQEKFSIEKKSWILSDIELTKEQVRKRLSEFVSVFVYTENYEEKNPDEDLIAFSKKIENIVEKDFSVIAKNRATVILMPQFLDELDSLMQTPLVIEELQPSSSSAQIIQPQLQTTASAQTCSTDTVPTIANNT